MSVQLSHNDFSLLSGGHELLDRVEPLWVELRQHHAKLSVHWSASLLAASFESRRIGLVQKAARGLSVVLATNRGFDVGYCVSTIAADNSGEVDSLFVAPSHRRLGIGNALMEAAIDWLNRYRVESIAVDVLSGNDAAIQFYSRYGFTPRTIRLIRQTTSSAGSRREAVE